MNVAFIDRVLLCADCQHDFVFTAGEQVFFHEKEFKNDPKRCKPCKARRSGLTEQKGAVAASAARTETRTECSECGIETTVPFRPTQGRPVRCRICFQLRGRAPARVPATVMAQATASALTELSTTSGGAMISANAAVMAATSIAGAVAGSSVASAADLASIYALEPLPRMAMPMVEGRREGARAGLGGAS